MRSCRLIFLNLWCKQRNVFLHETVALIKANAEKKLAQTSDETERTKLVQIIQQVDQYLTANKTTYETWKEGGIGRALLQSGVGGVMTGRDLCNNIGY